jgi:hypothetical protein
MHIPAGFWFLGRHEELIREADQQRLAREARRARKLRARADESETRRASPRRHPVVRLGRASDAPRIAVLLELNGMPRWVAFEERFIVVEEGGMLTAAMRFREGVERLYLGLLITDPWADEFALAVALYSEARAVAEGLGLRGVRAQTRAHETYLREAGYRRWRGGWTCPTRPAEATH